MTSSTDTDGLTIEDALAELIAAGWGPSFSVHDFTDDYGYWMASTFRYLAPGERFNESFGHVNENGDPTFHIDGRGDSATGAVAALLDSARSAAGVDQ